MLCVSDADDHQIVLLPIDTPEGEHPDEGLTDMEAAAGLALYKAIDDTDDQSNGFETVHGLMAPVTATAPGTGYTEAMRRAGIVKGCMLRHGVPEVSIELVKGRPSGGDDWNACRPVAPTSHHIASNPTPENPTPGLHLVTVGRSDLPGPLCNGTAGVDLVYRIKTLGYANHPGFGGPLTLSGPMGKVTIPKDNGRPYLWGTEYEGGFSDAVWDRKYTNKRTGKTMTFREFMGRCNAALAEACWLINGHGRKPVCDGSMAAYHTEHKTWAPTRKVDRLNYTTASGRAEAARYHQEEDDVSAADVWKFRIPNNDPGAPKGSTVAASMALAQARTRGLRALTAVNLLAKHVKDLPDDVADEIRALLAEESK